MDIINLPPNSKALIESMRDIGYSIESAVADVIDNSITANSKNIHLEFFWNGGNPWIAIIDDGYGMTLDVLKNAMRFGSASPLNLRDENDLGRFGLGLKTASFSQCRELTVISKQNSIVNAAQWDLDRISKSEKKDDNWELMILSEDDLISSKIIMTI